MKFIKYNKDLIVTFIHHMPFDEVNGLGKTKDELLKEGALVEEFPQVEIPENKIVKYKYNKENNEVEYDLIDRPLTKEEQKLKNIEDINKDQDRLINNTLLVIDKLFTILKSILPKDAINKEDYNIMANLYLDIVERGLKDIEEIPVECKEQIQKLLK